MSEPKSAFLSTLEQRGFIHQCTDMDGLDKRLSQGVMPAYIGFDCTADSLHVGSLVQIMMLRWLQKSGHKPIVLMGGGTTKVGDPSGKDESRQLLDDETIERNMAGIRKVFEKFLTFGDGPTDAIMVNNADWLDKLEYIPFLRDVGRHFTINRMLKFDSVRMRLDREQPLTFLEFNYMILQAYDYYELARRMDCALQMGGSDQWGNIVNGMELSRRLTQKETFGLTTPLLTTASGQKMGKTHSGAIWLNEDRLSAYDYWQFWRNTEDSDVGRFLRLFTELPMDEIARLEALEGQDVNEAKKVLANEATRMARGDKAAQEAAETAHQTFVQGNAAEGLPTVEVPGERLTDGIGVLELFVTAGLAGSNGEVRKLIQNGGVKINDEKVSDPRLMVTNALSGADGTIKLSMGKKKHALVKAQG